jgi:glutaredoxin
MFCLSRKAKELIESLVAERFSEVKVIELDETPDGAELQKSLLSLTGRNTVPNIFIQGQVFVPCTFSHFGLLAIAVLGD